MPIKTKRWNDPVELDDDFRLLVTRYRPRGVRKDEETWREWRPALAPSRELHRAWYPREGERIPWSEFTQRYLDEMKEQRKRLAELAQRSCSETITLLCSNACTNPEQCHRTLLKRLIEKTRC